WFNLIAADLIRVYHLPLFQTQFMGMYVLGSLLLGAAAYEMIKAITSSRVPAWILLFFIYFGGDVTYIFTYFSTKQFQFNVPTIIERGLLGMDNPPRAYSNIIAFAIVYFLYRYI